MTARWVCRYCIATVGLRGPDLGDWPAIDDEAAQYRHIESEHHIPVVRPGESNAAAVARLRREQPGAGDPALCKCPACVAAW